MNSKNINKKRWAIGVASFLVSGAMLILPSAAQAAQADQLDGGGSSASRFYNGLDIDDLVADRKVEMAQALVDRD